jgi:ABC-type Fe3+-hydroxamate transport system substrate-binding protein
MPLYTDQLSRTVNIVDNPKRIISVVPSQTELLHYLGLENEVIAITKFCIHPYQWFRTKIRIGGTKRLNLEKIKELNPDLILAHKEENNKKEIEELVNHFPVWISDIDGLDSAYWMIKEIGQIVGKEKRAEELLTDIRASFAHYNNRNIFSKPGTAYLIWKDPYMTIGGDTFIHHMLEYAGFKNIFSYKTRYPEIKISDLTTATCQVLLLSSEPYPFQQKHIDELQSLLPDTKFY